MTSEVTPEEIASVEQPSRRRRFRWVWWTLAGFAVIVAAVGFYVWREYRTLTSAKYQVVDYTVPKSSPLVAQSGETVYRIDPTRSRLTYAVDEKLFGQDANRAHGSTNGIAGDIAINETNPKQSRLGEIVVNVEQLHSDNNLRDARLRQANLDSHDHPLAYLTAGDLTGMPAHLDEGTEYQFKMPSQLTVRDTPAAVVWDVTASLQDGKLTATATANVKMSTFGIGPISVAGLVSTSDDVTLQMDLTAVDPARYAVPTAIKAPASAPRSGDSPSFAKVVQPILETHCVSCHEAGEVGASHWTVKTAGDVQDIADGIGTVVRGRYMPPWPASDAGVPLAHSKRLDDHDYEALLAWSRAGGQLDVPRSERLKPRPGPEGDGPRHDVTMKMPEAYAGSLSVPNDYRCFVLDPHITKPTFMTGYEVTPGNRAEIHHAQIFQIDASQVEASHQLDGRDGKPGWSCYSGPLLRSSQDNRPLRPRLRGFTGQAGLVAGWVPGQDPVIFPMSSGILLQPGDALVLQIHYHYNTTPVPDRSTVALQLDPGTAPIKHLDIVNPIAPVEIPCEPGQQAPLCDRDAALADAARQYGGLGAGVEGGLLALCHQTKESLAARYSNGVAHTSCDYRVPADGLIVGVLGHMHTLGQTFRYTLDPDTPNAKVLLDIPNWNFDWQMNYQLAKPLHVTEGQTLRMECSWDRSREPNRPPKYIIFAEGTEDEMCFGTYGLIRDDQSSEPAKN
jgi:polyisoprenoid-binding protein YceI/mono/diheme cytochrome c family protein